MRRLLGWILLVAGIGFALAGLFDAATAWWDQPIVGTALDKSIPAVPDGFAAKLEIPRLDASLYVVKAKTSRDFRRGPGYIVGSSLPGQSGNTIIAGHRDLHFRVLKDIAVGDVIEIETKQGRFRYRVSSTQIVGAKDRDALRPSYPQQLTLVTCYPFYYVGPAPKRFLVKAYLLNQS